MLYLNDCDCGRKHCLEKAASTVKTHLTKVSLNDASVDFLIEYAPVPFPTSLIFLDLALVTILSVC